MAPRAQLSQERSRQRRDALLNAAVDLFVEGGSRAVTHRAVAAAAGLPPATTTYYFATIDDLLRDALNHHIEQWLATMEGLAATDPMAMLPLITQKTAVEFAAAVFEARPPSTATRELAVILGAARLPELREAAVTALTTAIDVLVNVLNQAGVPDPKGLGEDFMAVIAGVAVRRTAGVNTEAEEAANLVRALRNLAVGHLTDDEEAAAVLGALRDRALSGGSGASR